MSWQAELTLILRELIDDVDCPETYTDGRLQRLIALAGQKVLAEVDITTTYTIVVGKNSTISPDPTDDVSRDNLFINLMLLKASCIIDRLETKKAADNALVVRDGESLADTRDSGKHRLALLKIGPCAEYEDAVFAYETGNANLGVAILSPFRVYANSRDLSYISRGRGD